jgi:tetratricopeptide (TPR) repeat protein
VPFVPGTISDIEWAASQRDAAKAEYQQCVKMILADADHENDAGSCAALGWFYVHLWQMDDALREAKRAAQLEPISKSWKSGACVLNMLALVEAQLGHADKAVPILDQLLSTAHGTVVSISTVRSDVEWDPIRTTPEFKQLLQRHASQ